MNLSIVIASVNDQDETYETIKSIRGTAGEEPEIVLVDDCSGTPLSGDWRFQNQPNLKLVSNRWRCGCGPSRHIGALHAAGDWLLIIDSHMRFTEGWYQEALKRLYPLHGSEIGPGMCVSLLLEQADEGRKIIYCACCLGLDEKHMDVRFPKTEYRGATINFIGPDRQKPGKTQTLECVWLPKEQAAKDDEPLAACMGACYFISKQWFFHLDALRFLRTWGGDELMLSMKSWLAGGEVRFLETVRIGHKFWNENLPKSFNTPCGHVEWNKLLAARTLFPDDIGDRLEQSVLRCCGSRDAEAAKALYRQDFHIIQQERARNASIFVHDARWFAERFGLKLP